MHLEWLVAVGGTAVIGCGSNTLEPIQAPVDASAAASDTGASGDVRVSLDAHVVRRDSTAPAFDASHQDAAARPVCKRGIATNTLPSASLVHTSSSPGVAWWYDWSTHRADGGTTAMEIVPMVWGSAALGTPLPIGASYVLGFNEPNFKAQSDLPASQAALDWPQVEAAAKASGAALVSPAVNYCGSPTDTSQCSDPTVTDPYTYLKDFFADCPGCQVDAVAVHWYNCDLPSLQAYLEGNLDSGGGLQGFTQFGKPIWLTEFSCDGTHSVEDQAAYMNAAIPYLESNPHVNRYSWFSASAIPNAQLMNADGSVTALGATYAALPASCD